MPVYVLGIDLGTTGCKSMVFDTKGAILGSSYIEYELIMTPEGIEQDSHAWWGNVVKTVRESVAKSGVEPGDVAALCVSSQGIAYVPVGEDGAPLYHAISWLDGRATKQIEEIREALGDAHVFSRTGKPLLPCYVLPQLMWLKENRPAIYEKTHKALMSHDYILYRMTGAFVTDLSMASGTLGYDVVEKRWIEEWFSRFHIDIGKLPALLELGTLVGSLHESAAAALGLSTGTKVVVGAQDQRCASIGAGIQPGVFTVSLGTSSAICAITNTPILDEMRQVTCCALNHTSWVLETVVSTAGVAYKWLKNTFFPSLSFASMDALAKEAAVLSGGVMFFPNLSLEQAGGPNGMFTGLSLQTTQKEVIRSVLEGVAFQMKQHIENMERLGVRGEEIRLFGGGATSPVWCQMIADVTGKRVQTPATHETANLGAAMIAAVGAGIYENLQAAGSMRAGEPLTYIPDKANQALYEQAYPAYKAQAARAG